MSRITPSTRAVNNTIDADEFYEVTIETLGGIVEGTYGDQLQVDLQYEDASTVRDWLGLKLGKAQNGTVAKLRQFLNSVAGKPYDAEIKWFDSETMEWSYDTEPFDKLSEGRSCLARGIRGVKDDGSPTFSIDAYRPIKKAPAARVAAKPAKADVDEIPF